MQIEQGIATQRLRLFRLVTGLLLAVAFVSTVPFSCACRRWFCVTVQSILMRAECAAQNLVIAQAVVLACRSDVPLAPRALFPALGVPRDHVFPSVDAVYSLPMLQRRLKVLRALLSDLPRHGLRLLRRALAKRLKPANRSGSGGAFRAYRAMAAWGLVADPIERPPDRGLAFLMPSIDPSLPKSGGRRFGLGRSKPQRAEERD